MRNGSTALGLRWHLADLLDRAIPGAIVLIVTLTLLFLAAPIIAVVGASFNKPPALAFPPSQVSLTAYRQMPTEWYGAFLTSVEVALTSTLLATVLAIPASFALVRGRLARRNLIEAALRSPLQTPQIVVAVALVQFFALFRIATGNSVNSFIALASAHTILVAPYVLGIWLSRIHTMDLAQEEAAAGLGASKTRTFIHVMLPALKSTCIAAACLSFVISFDNVTLSLFLTTDPTKTTLPVALFNQVELWASPVVFAGASVTIAISILVTGALEHFVGLRAVVGKRR